MIAAFSRTAPAASPLNQKARSRGEADTPIHAAKLLSATPATTRESPRTASAAANRLMTRRWLLQAVPRGVNFTSV